MKREGTFGFSTSWAALAATWALCASPVATAQVPDARVPLAPPLQAPPVPQDSARWLVTPNEMILSELVAGAAAAIGVPIDFNQADLQGTVTVRIPERVSAEELWELANLSLAARGLTTVQVPGGRSVGVVKLDPQAVHAQQFGTAGPRRTRTCDHAIRSRLKAKRMGEDTSGREHPKE